MREPQFAGSFYPRSREECRRAIDSLLEGAGEPHDAPAVVAPHAGWAYSGRTAARAFAALRNAPTVVLLSPSHSGARVPVASSAEAWRTPLGVVEPDLRLLEEISGCVGVDEGAHDGEHAVEVLLPFVQRFFPSARFLPIVFADQSLGRAERVARALAESERDFSVVASSDFTHYEPAGEARAKDEILLRALRGLDARAFYDSIISTGASACGYAPVACALSFALESGATRGELLHFSNSGEAGGDYSSVVDYAAVAFR